MIKHTGLDTPARYVPGRQPRKRHWWRWVLTAVVALIVLIVAAVALFIKLQPAPAPLALPRSAASAPAGLVDGTWNVSTGSAAGFRVKESALGFGNDVVGRTSAVTGTVAVSGSRVTSASFRIDLTTIKVNGKTQPQFAQSLGTRDHPVATFTLARAVTLSSAFSSGAAITVRAAGYLAMHGASHPVTVTISARRDGSSLQAAGSIPVAFSRWGIKRPGGFGFLGSLANHGVAEFFLVLRQQ
jgi:polyisoprenoid-binding protein YceI